mgnify:FL=1
MSEIGEAELCLFGDLLPDPVVIPATPEGARSLDDPGYTSWILGRSGAWGMRAEEGRLSVLGGAAEFMEVYLRHAGGEEAVRKRFEDHDISMGWEPSWPDSDGERLWRERTYALFGWSPMPYPNRGAPFARQADAEEIADRWAPALSRVLRTKPSLGIQDFADTFPAEWTRIILPGHLIGAGGEEASGYGYARQRLDAWWGLTAALREAEDWEVGIAALGSPADDVCGWTVTLPWARGLASAEQLAGCPLMALGTYGLWALISFGDGLSVVAGEPHLIERMVFWAGGADRLESELAHQVTQGAVGPEMVAAIVARLKPPVLPFTPASNYNPSQ